MISASVTASIISQAIAPEGRARLESGQASAPHVQVGNVQVDSSEALADDIQKRQLKQNELLSKNLSGARFAADRLVATLNDPATEPSAKTRAAQALADQIATGKSAGQLTCNAVDSGLAFLSARGQEIGQENCEQMANELAPLLTKQLCSALSDSGIESPIGVRSSFDDILDGLQDLIGVIKEDYLDVYARMVEAYAELFRELNEDVIGELHEWLTVVGDKGAVSINAKEIRAALDRLIAKYSLPNPGAVLFPVPGEGGSVTGASMEDALKWLTAMGLPPSCLKQLPDGSFCIVMDLSPLTEMKANLPSGDTPQLLPARFQAWQAAWNAQIQELESALQKQTQKYSNANSIHDNVQKVISSTLSALFEMLKSFAASLG